MRWYHSGPIVVIEEQEEGGRGTEYSIKQDALDLVVDHILSVLLKARVMLKLVKKESQKLTSNSKVGCYFSFEALVLFVCIYVCMYVCMYICMYVCI